MLFTGEYEHTIDAKHRLAVPAELRSRLDPNRHGDGFYVSPGANGALWLWPQLTFERMAGALEESLLPAEGLLEYEQLLFSQSTHVPLDSAGRVRLPERMLSEFELGDQVIILGIKDHLELRDPARWRAEREQMLAKQAELMLRARQALREDRGGNTDGS